MIRALLLLAVIVSAYAQCPTYTIQSGDTFTTIASAKGTTVAAIQSANPGVSSNALKPGQTINLPCASPSPSPQSTTAPSGPSPTSAVTISASQFAQALTVNNFPTVGDNVRTDLLSGITALGGSAVISSNTELAMLLAQAEHETGGLAKLSETNGAAQSYAPFFGRGYLQLTYQQNYEAASQALFGNSQYLVTNPNLVATNDSLAWTTALFYWKTNVHSVVQSGQFGAATKAINGAIECNGSPNAEATDRCNLYTKILPILVPGATPNCGGC